MKKYILLLIERLSVSPSVCQAKLGPAQKTPKDPSMVPQWSPFCHRFVTVRHRVCHWFITDSSPIRHRFVTGFLTGSSPIRHRFVTGSSPVRHRFVTGSSPVHHRFVNIGGYRLLKYFTGAVAPRLRPPKGANKASFIKSYN